MVKQIIWILIFTASITLAVKANMPHDDAKPSDIPVIAQKPLDAKTLKKIKGMLQKESPALRDVVINKVMLTLECAHQHNITHNNILTVIDYSLPSSQRRFWVFDLDKYKKLFYTYVSHGIKSGTKYSRFFSNINNSKASSIGVFNTEKAYRGRHGASLKLLGLEKNYNDNAYKRFIVMHGSWYVNQKFVEKYGRIGRSWGCPSLPIPLTKPIINTIKDGSLIVAYYPSEKWLGESKFLNCKKLEENSKILSNNFSKEEQNRAPILFADINNNEKREENEPIIAISATNYKKLFDKTPPLSRMLRRQINKEEYIALTKDELKKMDDNRKKKIKPFHQYQIKTVCLIIPEVKMKRGYYATEMKIISIGKIKKIEPTSSNIEFEKRAPVKLRSTNRFIRWLGL